MKTTRSEWGYPQTAGQRSCGRRCLSVLLALVLCLSLLPVAAFAADGTPCEICGNADGTHKDNCRFVCPTEECTVIKTTNAAGTTWTHSVEDCPYADPGLYCTECGYLVYRTDEDDYFHKDGCSIGYPTENPDIGEDNPPAAIATKYDEDGVTYFGVNSDHFDDSTKLFIQDMLSAKSDELGGKSTAALWQYLSFALQKHKGRGTNTGKFRGQFNDVIGRSLAYTTGSTGTYSANLGSGDNNYNTKSSGLVYANSMAAAAEKMEQQVYEWYRGAGGGRDDKYGDSDDAAVAKNSTLWNDTDSDDVFWMANGAFKTSGTNKKGHYQALGVLFSNFKITTILPEDDGDFYKSSTSEPATGSKTYASHVKNMTAETVGAQQEITNTTSATVASEINGSKEYGFEETVTIGAEKEFPLFKGSLEFSFTASQAISNGWSESKETSDEQSTSYNVAVELPPYTNVMMKQNSSETTETTTYNCPVALNFTVTVVEYTLDPTYNDADCRTQVLAAFGGNARKDLYQRGVIEQTLTDPNGIVWNNLYAANGGLETMVDTMLTATAPMASAGAKFEATLNTVTSEVSGLAPIYALSTIRAADNIMEYNLTPGEYLYVDNIELEGLNNQNAPYYGFSEEKGHWILVDKDGKPVDNSDVAVLETNATTGFTKLKAKPVEDEGVVYLKYLIDENCYATAENPTLYTQNKFLKQTAMIEVNVSPTPFEGTITVGGKLEGIAGDPAKPIQSTDGLTVAIKDSTGKHLSRAVTWDAQELPNAGITVKDNKVSFTKAGTFHVRARSGNVYSDWYEVTALPPRALTTISIPEILTMDCASAMTYDLSTLTVFYKDQYGADWTPTPALTWTCTGEGASIDGTTLTVPDVGTYTVTASGDGITSNPMTVTVSDSRVSVTAFTPAEKNLSSSGGKVEFVIAGQNLPDDIVIRANEQITAQTTGTDTQQKATLTFPANPSTTDAVTYTVTNSLDAEKTAVVTVDRQSAGGGGGGGGGGGIAAETFTLTFDTNGGSAIDKVTRTSGAAIDLTKYVPTQTGYTFGGWYTDKDLTEAVTSVKLTKNMTVYAKWTEETAPADHPFTDVDGDAYYKDAVLWAVENGVTNGTSGTTFSPDMACTRVQTVTFLWWAMGSPTPVTTGNPFTDVAADAYYSNAVLWAVEKGITNGTSETTFGPASDCTRGQIVAFLYRDMGE